MLKQIRKATGLTQRQFGELIGLKEGSYRQAEGGWIPVSKGLAKRISHETGCGLEYPSKRVSFSVDNSGRLIIVEPIGVRATCGQTEKPFTREWFEQTRRLRKMEARQAGVLDKLHSLEKCAIEAANLAVDEGRDRNLEAFLSDLTRSLFEVMNKHDLEIDALGASMHNDIELWVETGLERGCEPKAALEYLFNEIKAACAMPQ